MIFPINITNHFRKELRERFYVPNCSTQINQIQRQIWKLGQQVAQDTYEVKIHGIPAHVIMREATLISVRYVN